MVALFQAGFRSADALIDHIDCIYSKLEPEIER